MNLHTSNRTIFAGLAALLLIDATARSQDYPDRDSRRVVSGLIGPNYWMRPLQNQLSVHYPKKTPFSIPVPIEFPADHHAIPPTNQPQNLDRLLISGRDASGHGVLILIRVDGELPQQWAIVDTFSQPGSDFIGVAYSHQTQRLYLLERHSGLISRASFAPSASTLPTTWTSIAHSSQFGSPMDLSMRALALLQDGAEPRLSLPYVNREIRDTPTITDGVQQATFGLLLGDGNRAALSSRELRLGATSIPLVGPASTAAELLRMDGPNGIETVGSIVLDAMGHGTFSITPTTLVFGAVYGVRTSIDSRPSSPFVTPEKRWGIPGTLADGNEIMPLRWMGLTAFVGSEHFRMPCYVEVKNLPPSIPHSYSAVLLVGNESSSILNLNGTSILSTQFIFSTSIQIYGSDKPGYGAVRLPIPDDPLLGAAEIRFQWLVDDGVGLRVSDIAGIHLRPTMFAPPGNEGVLQGNQLQRLSSGSEARERAVRSWLEACGASRLSEPSRQELLRRLRR